MDGMEKKVFSDSQKDAFSSTEEKMSSVDISCPHWMWMSLTASPSFTWENFSSGFETWRVPKHTVWLFK